MKTTILFFATALSGLALMTKDSLEYLHPNQVASVSGGCVVDNLPPPLSCSPFTVIYKRASNLCVLPVMLAGTSLLSYASWVKILPPRDNVEGHSDSVKAFRGSLSNNVLKSGKSGHHLLQL